MDWPTMSKAERDEAKREFVEAIVECIGRGSASTITYGELRERVTVAELHGHDKRVDLLLNEIAEEHARQAGCLVTAVVVYKDTVGSIQKPGGGFFRLAEDLGYKFDDEGMFFADQLARAVRYWRLFAEADAGESGAS